MNNIISLLTPLTVIAFAAASLNGCSKYPVTRSEYSASESTAAASQTGKPEDYDVTMKYKDQFIDLTDEQKEYLYNAAVQSVSDNSQMLDTIITQNDVQNSDIYITVDYADETAYDIILLINTKTMSACASSGSKYLVPDHIAIDLLSYFGFYDEYG